MDKKKKIMGNNMKKIFHKLILAADHRGYQLKEEIKAYYHDKIEIIDVGCSSSEPSIDYPDVIYAAALEIDGEDNAAAVFICKTGNGVTIDANRFNFLRAVLCKEKEDAISSRKHNDANVITMGKIHCDITKAISIIDGFLSTEFEGGRHKKRIEKLHSNP